MREMVSNNAWSITRVSLTQTYFFIKPGDNKCQEEYRLPRNSLTNLILVPPVPSFQK